MGRTSVGVAAAGAGVAALTAIAVPTVVLWNGPQNMGDRTPHMASPA